MRSGGASSPSVLAAPLATSIASRRGSPTTRCGHLALKVARVAPALHPFLATRPLGLSAEPTCGADPSLCALAAEFALERWRLHSAERARQCRAAARLSEFRSAPLSGLRPRDARPAPSTPAHRDNGARSRANRATLLFSSPLPTAEVFLLPLATAQNVYSVSDCELMSFVHATCQKGARLHT